MTRKLKLYVWDGVLADWTGGMVVVLAHDVREARRIAAGDSDYRV